MSDTKRVFKPIIYSSVNEDRFTFKHGYPEMEVSQKGPDNFYAVFDYSKDMDRESSSVIEISLNHNTGFYAVSRICYGKYPERLGKYMIVGYESDTQKEIIESLQSFVRKIRVYGPYDSDIKAIQIAKRLNSPRG